MQTGLPPFASQVTVTVASQLATAGQSAEQGVSQARGEPEQGRAGAVEGCGTALTAAQVWTGFVLSCGTGPGTLAFREH